MKNITFLVIFIVLNSCNQNPRKTSNINQLADSVNNVSEKLDLTITLPKSKNRQIPKIWKSLTEIQKDWIEVKEDKDGYLIYEPCDGYTRRISFKNGYLYIQWQMEPAYKFSYDKFTRMTGNISFRLDAYEESTQTGFPINAKIIDAANGLVLWEFRNETEKEKWLMTPFENAENFRQIKNNCPDYKRSELKFIEQYIK